MLPTLVVQYKLQVFNLQHVALTDIIANQLLS